MKYIVRHALPGRIRVEVAVLRHKSDVTDALLGWLRAQDWVTSARINHECSCLVLTYDPSRQDEVDGLLDLVGGASPVDMAMLLAAVAEEAPAPPPRAKAEPKAIGIPLVGPTISLVLAFMASPIAMVVNVPLTLWNSTPIFKRTYTVIRDERRLNIDFLDTLAILASVGQGLMVTGSIVVWLIRLGDWIRDLTAAGAKRAASELLDFQGRAAWVLHDNQLVSVPAKDVKVGDTVYVHHGEMIPVDGEIIDGAGTIDQKTITGESLPVARSKGERAFAGTILHVGQLVIHADRVGIDTTAGQIAALVDSAPVGDTRMQNHAERFADRLVTPTLGLAVGASVLTADFNRFLSLVIIDFGTGIRVSAPTAVLASMTQAARSGIIIKSGGHMEKLAAVDTIVFDKTGTLTMGTPSVRDVRTYLPRIEPNRLLALAVAAETKLRHPVADAIRSEAAMRGLEIPACHESDFSVGKGVAGEVDGHCVHVGSQRFLRELGIPIAAMQRDREVYDEQGCSCMYVAIDGKAAGLIAYADRIRPESSTVLSTLRNLGVRDTVMLTGDNPTVAAAVSRNLGVTSFVADMLPSDKASVVQEMQRAGRSVAMVGDGINDSPALSFADVGIAMKHGADITHESADVVLMEDSLWKLVEAVRISRGAVRLIKQNYGIVAALNGVALALTLPGGLISPAMTAVMSNGSAILASLNGVRPLMRRR